MATVTLLGLIITPPALFLAAINGFLGKENQAKAENFCLKVMGESRGSYFLKNMTPFQNTLIHEQGNVAVDVGQTGYTSGVKVGDSVGETVGRVGQDIGGSVDGFQRKLDLK